MKRILIWCATAFGVLVLLTAVFGPKTDTTTHTAHAATHTSTRQKAATAAPSSTPAPETPSQPVASQTDTAVPPAAQADIVFITTVVEFTGPLDPTQADKYRLIGHKVCTILDSDPAATRLDMAQGIIAGGLSSNVATAIVGAATGVFCPQDSAR